MEVSVAGLSEVGEVRPGVCRAVERWLVQEWVDLMKWKLGRIVQKLVEL